MAELKLSLEEAFARAEAESTQGNLVLGKQIYAELVKALPLDHPLKKKAQDRLQALQPKRLSSEQRQALIQLNTDGNVEAALAQAQDLAKTYPEDWFIHDFMGSMLLQLGELEKALTCYDQAIKLNPTNADCYANKGGVLNELNQYENASSICQQALSLNRQHVNALVNYGVVLSNLEQEAEALKIYDQALALDSTHLNALVNRGSLLNDLGRLDEALESCDRALELEPNHINAFVTRASVLKSLERYEEALESYNQVLAINPQNVKAHLNKGSVLNDFGHFEEAYASFNQVLAIDKTHVNARLNRSFLLLLKGDLNQGWQDYELRFEKNKTHPTPSHTSDRWQGQDLASKSIILLAEQGLGDQIQFCRYAKHLSNKGAKVILECHPRLVPLMQSCSGIDTIVAKGADLPKADYHCPLLSVPGVIGEDLSQPFEVPYLFADEKYVSKWAKNLKDLKGFKIGASWQGSTQFTKDKWRSFPLEHFGPLAALAGVSLVSLQKGDVGVSQIASFQEKHPLIDPENMLEGDSDLMDAAAIMTNLNLVITSCTAIAHLGGALGVPTWVILGKSADWRWFLDREDSPWYPSVRLFRQSEFGDWNGVFQRVTKAVKEEMKSQWQS